MPTKITMTTPQRRPGGTAAYLLLELSDLPTYERGIGETTSTAVDSITGGGATTSALAAAAGEVTTMTTKCRASEEESSAWPCRQAAGSDRGGGESDDVGVHEHSSIMFDGAVVTWGILPLLRKMLLDDVDNKRSSLRGGSENNTADQNEGGEDVADDDDEEVESVRVLLTAAFGGPPRPGGLDDLDVVPHLRQPDGWSCGYRNLQMLMCHIISGDDRLGDALIRRSGGHRAGGDNIGSGPPEDGARLEVAAAEDFEKAGEDSDSPPATPPPFTLPRNLPTVLELQRLLEGAWSDGYDPDGARHYNHRIVSTKKRIGAVEVTSLLRYLGVDATVVQFVKTAEGRAVLAPFVWNHFLSVSSSSSSSSPCLDDDRVGVGANLGANGSDEDVRCRCDGCGSGSADEEVASGGCDIGDDEGGGDALSAWELLSLTQDLGAIDVDVDVDEVSHTAPKGGRCVHDRPCRPPPLYLQWAGHSVTVVGIVRRRRRSRGSTRLGRTVSGEGVGVGGDDSTYVNDDEDDASDFDLLVFDPLRDCSGLRSRLLSSLSVTKKKEGVGEGDDEKEEKTIGGTEEEEAVPSRGAARESSAAVVDPPHPSRAPISSNGATTTAGGHAADSSSSASVAYSTMIGCDYEKFSSSLLSPLRLPAESLLRRDCQIVHCRRWRSRCGCRSRCRHSSLPSCRYCEGSSPQSRSQPSTRKRRRRPPEEEGLDPRKKRPSSSSSSSTTSPSYVGVSKHGGDDRDDDGEEGEKAGVGSSASGDVIKGVRSVTATGIRKRR